MHHDYRDILKLTKRKPLWWDENGVPRFCRFHPRLTANIYASYTCLLLIACQNCNVMFQVCMSWNDEPSFKKDFDIRLVHYGDPPNACCGTGATMNCFDLKVLQWWERKNHHTLLFDWARVKDNEVELPDFQETAAIWQKAHPKAKRLRFGYKHLQELGFIKDLKKQ